MTTRALVASGLVSWLVLAACSSDAAAPPVTPGNVAGTAGTAAAGSSAGGSSGAGAVAGASGSAVGGSAGSASGGAGAGGLGNVAGAAGSAGASGSAGSAGSAGSGGAAGAGGSGCNYKLCEGFEGVAPGAQGSDFAIDVDKKGTVVETNTSKAHGGTHAVHIKTTAVAGVFGYITESKSLAATGASFWGRVFLWSDIATAPSGEHIVNIAVDGKTGDKSEQVRILNIIGDHLATNRRSDDAGKNSNVKPTMGKWSCYEWHITPNNLQVFLDGTELPIAETWVEPTLSLLRVGFERFTTGSAGEMWVDDLAINDTQIGCTN